ncbi:ammonium transporter [Sphingobium bisphenolivorans]|uniref:ammonium transporter n=1 Tax=Sphingobium bisphenolivorans TaxID=1335760 RepID=UPI0003A15388|nr:ammonium transporter [Sphingobium bisphenolivorans]
MRLPPALLLVAAGTFLPQPALAQVAVADSGDTGWLMLCSLLVMLGALPGLLLRHAGLTKARSALSIMTQGIAVAAGASLLWGIAGYSLAFAPGSGWLGSGANLFLANLGALREGLTVPESAFALFQMALALLAACLLPAAVAERVRIGWMATFAPLWLLLVYAPVAHWIWAGGWLAATGVIDFAGAIVLHVSAGFSALVLTLIVGPRRAASTPGHSPVLTLVGGALLWIGWAGIVGGWALGATDDAATAIISMHFAASAGALSWALLDRALSGRARATGLLSGALAGLVAISASAPLVGAGGAMLIGFAAAAICRLAKALLKDRIDDAADIFLIHGIGGLTGALLLVPFVLPEAGGVGFQAGIDVGHTLAMQLVGVVVVALWAMLGSAILALILSLVMPPRLEPEVEAEGLDLPQHGQQGWDFR